MHVAQNIPVIIDNRHGFNVTYYSLVTPLALGIMTSRLTTCIICYYFMIAYPDCCSNLYPVFSLFIELLHYLRQHMCYLLSNAFSLNVDKYIA